MLREAEEARAETKQQLEKLRTQLLATQARTQSRTQG